MWTDRTRSKATRGAMLPLFALLGVGTMESEAAGPAPEWARNITPGTWAAISLNSLKDLDPAQDPEVNPAFPRSAPWRSNQAAVLDAWNGGALATGFGKSGALVVIGGGHADYYGNEVYAFDLESRRWQRLTNPYPSPSFPIADGIWPDGTPSVPHTYDQVDYHPASNSLVMMKTQYHNGGGSSTPVVAMFSFDGLKSPDSNPNRSANAKNWRFSTVHIENYASSGGWSAYDSKRDVFWANGGAAGRSFVSFDPKPAMPQGRFGAFETYRRRSGITEAVAAYDPVNDIVVFTTFRNGPDVWAIDLLQPGAGIEGNLQISQSGSPPALEESHGWEWSPTRRAFLYYQRGDGVFEFKQSGSDWRAGAWTWSQLTSPTNSVVPTGENKNGVFSRFRIATFDDAEIALVVHEVDGPVYAFKVPAGESRPKPRQPRELIAD